MSVDTMTPRERVLAALAGEPVDRPPVSNPASVATVELMDLVDAPFPAACHDPDLSARLAATGHTELGFDSVAPYFSIVQEASALGCEIQWETKDNWPTVRMSRPIWQRPEDVRVPSGFLEHPDCQTVFKAIEILRKQFGGEVAIVGKAIGLWTMAYQVFGVENFLMMTVDDPDMARRCLDRLKEVIMLSAEAQVAAGADVLTVAEGAMGDLVSGEYYRRFLLELHQEMAERLEVPLVLHICGDSTDRLDYVAESGAAMFHFDSKTDPQRAKDIVGDRIGLVGNVDNAVTLYARGPAEVRGEVNRCLDAGINMIAPGCAIPLATRLENLIEIPSAVQDWSRKTSGGA